jgi:hypothetical protein
MQKPLKTAVMILAFYLGLGLGIGLFELVNGGPWYTFENIYGDRQIFGQEPAPLMVKDENGKALSIISGYAFPGTDTTVTRSKGSKGQYVFTQNQTLPIHIKAVNSLFYPLLYMFRQFV